MGRHELTEVHWHQLAPLLPPQKSRGGRPSLPHRRIINGIIWIQATGAPWRDVPAQYGSWHTVSSRFCGWQHAGIWPRLLRALQRLADCQGQLDWSVYFVDSTFDAGSLRPLFNLHNHVVYLLTTPRTQAHLIALILPPTDFPLHVSGSSEVRRAEIHSP